MEAGRGGWATADPGYLKWLVLPLTYGHDLEAEGSHTGPEDVENANVTQTMDCVHARQQDCSVLRNNGLMMRGQSKHWMTVCGGYCTVCLHCLARPENASGFVYFAATASESNITPPRPSQHSTPLAS